MRGLRSTIALLVVLLGLGAYIYFVTWKRPEGGAEAPKERVFVSLDADKIDEITVKAESGDTTTLKKVNQIWQITAPLTARADEMQASALATNLSTLDIIRVVDENPADVKEYSLTPPRVEIEFKASGDKNYADAHRLILGGKSPTTGDLFARRDADKRVMLVAGFTDPIFNRVTYDLRDKTVLAFDREKVDRIDLPPGASGGPPLQLAKEGGDWKVTKPIVAVADNSVVDSVLGRLQALAMKSIVAEQATPSDLTKYGFDKPQATVTLTAGGTVASLVIGGEAPGPTVAPLKPVANDVYVRDSSKPLITTVDGALLEDLRKSVDAYRRKAIFAFRGYSTDRLEFTRDGQTIVFEKVKAQGETPEKWRRASPNAGDPSAMAMEDLLMKLEALRATGFVDSPAGAGLDKPSLTVYAKFEDGKKEERVAFANSGLGDVYASSPAQPGALKIPVGDFDNTLKALDAVSK